MASRALGGWDRRRLKIALVAFFVALVIPTAILIGKAFDQLKWEAFHRHRVLAEELSARIDARLGALIEAEEAHRFTEFSFLVVAGDPAAGYFQPSPLSDFPVGSAPPGLIGHFQVDADGLFSTPLLPDTDRGAARYGVSETELTQRYGLQERIRSILSDNRLVERDEVRRTDLKPNAPSVALSRLPASEVEREPKVARLLSGAKDRASVEAEAVAETLKTEDRKEAMSPAVEAQAAFDRLSTALTGLEKKTQALGSSLGNVEDLALDSAYEQAANERSAGSAPSGVRMQAHALSPKRRARKERGVLPVLPELAQSKSGRDDASASSQVPVITTFESELDPLELSLLDSGHFVLYRKVWREGRRYIQGALVERQPFLEGVIETAFRNTSLSRMSNLAVAYQGNVLSAFAGNPTQRYLSRVEEMRGELLYRTHLAPPLGDVELIFSINRLPSGPEGTLIGWVAGVLALVLCSGFGLMYRLGAKQIDLARQQQDFVSAVSHELKTPLTSIRMYGEMLREGWTSEEKRKTYYDYIYEESERLSRLIENVLQLARMTRNELRLEPRSVPVAELIDMVGSKIGSQVERAGFELSITCDDAAGGTVVSVDTDAFLQIVINLVDNAIKFSGRSARKLIEIAARREVNGGMRNLRNLRISVRDHGPGVPKEQMRKIFRLFYRSENELTRETVGTGIGLALVHQLALAMGASIDVVNQDPGAEFTLLIPSA